MATRRLSIAVEGNDHQVTDAVGAAVVTAPVELTIDTDGLIASGLSSTQIRMQVLLALEKLHAYIETSGKFNMPG
ncbi:hypothetical protein FP568_13265 [Pandoraea pnomenusa]|uniref:hypothetical protein n=1 Tax=Pandoraea pnomenusa TaxID=93220 RepID=UPI0011987BB0|nr:hypothetical protein [Pandoraea pnomenusa]QDX22130.1 hypothetical protein FP568_13265 [Pandoraea pnomenusa]